MTDGESGAVPLGNFVPEPMPAQAQEFSPSREDFYVPTRGGVPVAHLRVVGEHIPSRGYSVGGETQCGFGAGDRLMSAYTLAAIGKRRSEPGFWILRYESKTPGGRGCTLRLPEGLVIARYV